MAFSEDSLKHFDGVFQAQNKQPKKLPRLFLTNLLCFNGNSFETLAKLIVLMRLKKPVWRILPTVFAPRRADAANAPVAGPLSEGQMTGISRETNILEPPSTAAKHFPSLRYSAALAQLTGRHSRRAPRCVFCWFHRFRCSMIGLCCSHKDAQDVLLTSLLLCCYPGQFSFIPPQLQSCQTYLIVLMLGWSISQTSSHLIIRRCCYRNRMNGRILWGIAAGFTFCSVSSIRVIADVM